MKKALVLILLSLILGNAMSQTEQMNIIKGSPLSLLLLTGSVFYEHKIDDKHFWQLGLASVNFNLFGNGYNGIMITPEYRIYVHKDALAGLYIGPFLRYQNFKLETGYATGKYSSFGGGVLLGRQWIYKKGFVIDIYVGPIYNAGSISNNSETETFHKPGPAFDGLGIRPGIAIGYSF